jgi:type I restriction enzyme, S subunit
MHSSSWRLVSLGEVLKRALDVVQLEPMEEYRQITVRLHHRGVVLRGVKRGANISSSRQYRASAGQLILSRIDARNGAIGIVPPELDGAIVTNDFWLFTIDSRTVLPHFLDYFVGTEPFVSQCVRASEGTTNRVRLQPERFLNLSIPLPPMAEQRRITMTLDELTRHVQQAWSLRSEATAIAAAMRRAVEEKWFPGNMPPAQWPVLGTVVDWIENGWSPQCESYPAADGEWAVLKVGAVSTGRFVATENKQLPATLSPRPELGVRAGDFLMSRANTTELVGACAVVERAYPNLMLCDKIFRFHFRPEVEVNRRYLEHALKSVPLRKQIEGAVSGTSSSMKNISKPKVLALRLPLTDRQQQDAAVHELDQVGAKLACLLSLQDQSDRYLSALIPATLRETFASDLMPTR